MNATSQVTQATHEGLCEVKPSELRMIGGGLFEGIIFINRGGWTCGTFDPRHGLPGSTALRVPNY